MTKMLHVSSNPVVHIFESLGRRTHLRPLGGTTVGLNALGSLVHLFDSQRFQQLLLLASLPLQSRLIQEYLHFLVVSGQSPLLHLFDFFEMLNTLLWVLCICLAGRKCCHMFRAHHFVLFQYI